MHHSMVPEQESFSAGDGNRPPVRIGLAVADHSGRRPTAPKAAASASTSQAPIRVDPPVGAA